MNRIVTPLCRTLVLAGGLALLGIVSAQAAEKSYPFDRVLRSGEELKIDIPDRVIRRVDVLVRRLNANDTDCSLTAGYKNQPPFNQAKPAQVDRQDLHEVVIMADGKSSRDRDLFIKAHNGDVEIREVQVHYD